MSEVQERPRFHLTIQHFRKTQEGAELIHGGTPFVLGGVIYQGYQGIPLEVRETQLSDSEMDRLLDMDGTKEKVVGIRRDRLHAREIAKEREYAERDARKRARRRDELELKKLEAELGEPSEGKALVPDAPIFKCDLCEKAYPTKQRLRGHLNFAHKTTRRMGRPRKAQTPEAPPE